MRGNGSSFQWDFFKHFPLAQVRAEGIFLEREKSPQHWGSNCVERVSRKTILKNRFAGRGKTVTAPARKTKTKSGNRAHPKVRISRLSCMATRVRKQFHSDFAPRTAAVLNLWTLCEGWSSKYVPGLSAFRDEFRTFSPNFGSFNKGAWQICLSYLCVEREGRCFSRVFSPRLKILGTITTAPRRMNGLQCLEWSTFVLSNCL